MTDKISVIVPVYKVERYLDRCVESIAAQTYENLEIILVDDGSPDCCGELCDRWEKKDPRVKVVHKENGGLSSARNAGLAVATGKYVGFIDSDDYILPQMYEKLYAALVENAADVSVCNYAYVDEKTDTVDLKMQAVSPVKTEVLTRQQAYRKIDPLVDGYSYYVTAWNKLYPRSLFDDMQFKEGFIHEDEFFVHHLFSRCNRIATVSDALYMYVQRSGSITKGKATVRSLHVVYALYDRYSFFYEIGEREMAGRSLQGACWAMEALLPRLHEEPDVQQIRKTVHIVLGAMLKNLDRNAIWLLKAWLQFVLRKK